MRGISDRRTVRRVMPGSRDAQAGLGIGQLFVIVFGFLITSMLIFLFGIWVGSDLEKRRLEGEERVVRAPVPVQPTAKEESKGADVDLSFYQKLKEKAEQRLQETAAVAPTAVAPTVANVVQLPTPTRSPVRMAEKPTVAPVPPTRAKVVEAPPTRAKVVEAPPARDEWADAGWTVQVIATTDSQQAADLARTLKSRGYEAYTVQAPVRGQTWYRVRVGRFTSREKAKELETRLKTAEGMENAYVAPQ
jgi:cell division septation protein DedD